LSFLADSVRSGMTRWLPPARLDSTGRCLYLWLRIQIVRAKSLILKLLEQPLWRRFDRAQMEQCKRNGQIWNADSKFNEFQLVVQSVRNWPDAAGLSPRWPAPKADLRLSARL